MSDVPMGKWIGKLARIAALALGLGAVTAAMGQYTFTTVPDPPEAGAPFTVSMSGPFPDGFMIDPQVTVSGRNVTVLLRGSCLFLCPPSVPGVRSFTIPALPAGTYSVSVYNGFVVTATPDATVSLAVVSGTPTAIPTLSPAALAILVVMLAASAAWVERRRA